MIFCFKWGNCNVLWKLANWKWSECALIEDIIKGYGPGAPPIFPAWLREDTKEEEKRKRFIRLLCKVRGEPPYDEKKEVKTNIKITAKDIEMVVKAVSGIDVTITEEK